jgi:hypothetical protein
MRSLQTTLLFLALAAPIQAQHEHHAPAPAEGAVLSGQITAARRATERYLDHANAVSDGYKLFGAESPLMGEHWYHPDLVRKPLDLNRPATLQYATINGRRTLVGVAYNVYQRPGDPLPEGFAGTTDHWHVHDIPKLAKAIVADRPFLRWVVDRRAEQGRLGAGGNRSQLVMVHAWIWSDNPDGMFAQQQRVLPYLRAGLPSDWAQRADDNAAWGVALLHDGCKHELGRLNRLARLSSRQRDTLTKKCADATETVRQAAAKPRSASELNATAARAWQEFTQQRDASLTADQKRRLEAVVEPMMH